MSAKRYHQSADGLWRVCNAQTVERCRAKPATAGGKVEHRILSTGELKKLNEFLREPTSTVTLQKKKAKTEIDLDDLMVLVKDPNADQSTIKYLADKADSKDTSAEELNILSKSSVESIRMGVAKNQNTSRSALETLSKDEKAAVREAVAANQACPEPVLNQLSQDRSDRVKESVASNIHCPVNSLDRLSRDKDWGVKSQVAKNASSSSEILDRLVRENNGVFDWEVAGNPSCSIETLRQLSQNENSIIRYKAEEELQKRKVSKSELHLG